MPSGTASVQATSARIQGLPIMQAPEGGGNVQHRMRERRDQRQSGHAPRVPLR